MNDVRIVPLAWADPPLGEVHFPKRSLVLRHGIGSGLGHDPLEPGIVWAIADRGPNLELHTAVDHYGWQAPASEAENKDAKLMVRLDLGPYMARLRVGADTVSLQAVVPLRDQAGKQVPGTPIPDDVHGECEPAFTLDGEHLQPSSAGMDTEGISVLADGRIWLAEEYGPSLVELDRSGQVRRRLVPAGLALADAPYKVEDSLPAIAARRFLNRGFEAVTAVPSEQRLFLAFQSPLAHPDRAAFEQARHLRIWELDPDGRVEAQYLYPLDPPDSFRRDAEHKQLGWRDLKVCELAAVGERTLLVLERSKRTAKIYRVEAVPALRVPAEHLLVDTRPTLEELSATDPFALQVLSKTCLFSSDEHPEVTPDMEGMAPLSDRSLLIVSDNDFGAEDKETRFFRLDFAEPFTG